MKIWMSFFAITAGSGFVAHCDTVVVPADRANQAGNLSESAGFVTSLTGAQTVYGAKNFPGQVSITGIAFRADEFAVQPSFDITIPRVTIRLTTYGGTPATFRNSYFFNKGPDDTLVFDGAVHWTGVNLPGATPNPFAMAINFTTPFTYNPAGGALLMEYDSAGPTGSSVAIPADFESHGDFTIGFTWENGVSSGNLVSQFTFESVPEPTTTSFIVFFGIALIVRSRRK